MINNCKCRNCNQYYCTEYSKAEKYENFCCEQCQKEYLKEYLEEYLEKNNN